ncbi:hypothetical protein BS47DRAFT_639027 [Hydnum rufescens UP504]|uniref:Endothelin-converting enzyme 1 n=1 Tax=Hydnum rufescens UP504 TaxID=1448309 RepID=A0A9P6BA18_9AGAM|nr:hypothetical protein BS47DRAFT_639027 [Hydnum rufescens UP504]
MTDSESAPLLASEEAQDATTPPSVLNDFVSRLLNEPLSALSKLLLALCLFLLLLSSVFIGLFAGTEQRLSEVPSETTVTEFLTTTKLVTSTRTIVSTTTMVVEPTPAPLPLIKTCTTPECVILAADVLGSMNMTADPCEDFYEFANGGWVAKNPLPPGKSRYTTFDQVTQANGRLIRGIFQRSYVPPSSSAETQALVKLKHFFSSCLDDSVLDEVGSEPLRAVVRKIRTLFPIPSMTPPKLHRQLPISDSTYEHDLTAVLAYLHSLDLSILFSLDIEGDIGVDPNFMTLWFSQSPLGLPSKEYYNDAEVLVAYTSVIRDLLYDQDQEAEEARAWPFPWPWPSDPPPENRTARADRLSPQIVAFERNLSQFGADMDMLLVDPLATYNPQPLENLTRYMTYMDFPGYASSFAPRHFPENVIVTYPPYVRDLLLLIEETDPEVIQAYLVTQAALQLSPYLGPNTFPWKVVNEFNQLLHGIKRGTPIDREEWCLARVEESLGFLTGHFFVQEAFSGSSRAKATDLIKDIVGAFNSALPGLKWMDKSSAAAAAEKASALRIKVGYPVASPNVENTVSLLRYYSKVRVEPRDFFGNILSARVSTQIKKWNTLGKQRDRNVWEMVPAEVNAYYEPPANEIVFPAGILQPPFFKEDWPLYVSYGAIGAVAAHELTHAFDSAGRLYNQDGKLESWWSNSTSEHFDLRKECLANQYSRYTVDDGKGHQERVNGNLTSGENIGDSGLIHSWRAWKSHINATTDFLLPGLEDFTREQLFFISFARIWATRSSPSADVLQVRTDPHSPAIYRVHGTLSNIPTLLKRSTAQPIPSLTRGTGVYSGEAVHLALPL